MSKEKRTMDALRLYGPMDMRLETLDIPECGEDDMRLRLEKFCRRA